MKIKKLGAMFLAIVMCMGMFSTTAFAYSGAEKDTTKEATGVVVEEKESEVETEAEEEIPYSYSVDEDGTIVFSFNGEEYTYDSEDETTGKVVTGGSRLNVRTGAGMNYEVIDQLRPGEEVSVIGTDGDWYQITVPAKTGYVHSDYLEMLENASNETDAALLQMFMMMFMDGMSNSSGSAALTPDGNMTLVDDFGSATGEGKQFITLTTKNGNTFYLIIDRDDKGTETVHFLNLVDEADLLALMEEAEVEEYKNGQVEPVPEEPEPTEPEVVESEEPVEEEKANMLPALILVIVLIGGGGAFAFMQIKKKKEQKEAEKPDPDADYVDDDEDYGYVDVDEESEDEEEDNFYDEEDNEPV